MSEFEHHHRASGPLGIFNALLATVLAAAFLWSHDSFFPLFLCFGVGAAILAVALWRSAWKKEAWYLRIASGALSWDYPKGATGDSGSIRLADISRVVVDDEQAQLRVTLKHGEEKKIRMAVSGYSLHSHLVSRHPHILTEYIESRHSSS